MSRADFMRVLTGWPSRYLFFRRDERGGAALEFSIVGLPFIAVIIAIIEVAVDFMISAQLDTALQKSVADIRSGTVQIQNMTAAQFKTQILCSRLTGLTCSSVLLNVVKIAQSTDWATWSPSSINSSNQKWCPGGSADAILVQVAYPVPLASMIWAGATGAQTGSRYYISSAGLRNDPFGIPVTQAGC
jgi:Flp pilus assembly protein TadG